jgi:RNA polymerase sigma factor (sigma-70 family)
MPDPLWTAFRTGDDVAFEQLYRTYYPVLFRYGRSLIHDDELVRDCLHDLFVSLCRYRATLQPNADPKLYLLGAFRRTLADHLRRETNRRLRSERWTESQHPADEVSPEFQLIQYERDAELTGQVRRAFGQLPRRQREAIHLRFFVGLEYTQIAEQMGVNYQSVLNLVQRGLRRMEDDLRDAVGRSAVLYASMLPFGIILQKFW